MFLKEAVCIIVITMFFCSCEEINNSVAKAKEKVEAIKEKATREVKGNADTSAIEKVEKKKFTGLRETKHTNGKIKSSCMYKDGRREGICKTFYDDGNLHIDAEYTDGEKNGYFRWFQKDGSLYQETNYKMNRKHGTEKFFWNNGQLKSEITYYEDKPALGLKEYTNTGKLLTNYPEIIIKEKNTVFFNNEYQLIITFKNLKAKPKDVEVYVGELSEGKYLDHVGLNWLRKNENNEWVYTVSVYRGSAVMKKINIFANVKTPYGNPLILKKAFNIAVTND